MIYCIQLEPGYIIGPFFSLEAAIKYAKSEVNLNVSMIQVMQQPEY